MAAAAGAPAGRLPLSRQRLARPAGLAATWRPQSCLCAKGAQGKSVPPATVPLDAATPPRQRRVVASYSVPCSTCSSAIRFGDEACRQCGARVSEPLKNALYARLEASSSEYRSMQTRVAEAVLLLVVVALLQFALGTFSYLALPEHANDDVRAVALLLFAVNGLIGAGLVASALIAKRRPQRGIVIGLAVWALPQLVLLLINPLALLGGAMVKLAKFGALVVLVRGVFAARDAEALRRELMAS